jgi:hypothetical protein
VSINTSAAPIIVRAPPSHPVGFLIHELHKSLTYSLGIKEKRKVIKERQVRLSASFHEQESPNYTEIFLKCSQIITTKPKSFI